MTVNPGIENLISKKVNISDMDGYLVKHDDAIISNRTKFAKVDKNFRDVQSMCQNTAKVVAKAVNTTTYNDDLKEISGKFSNCIQYHHLQKHLDIINPVVSECSDKGRPPTHHIVLEFEKEIKKTKEIIKRFDEVMCDKASKFSIDNLWHEFKEYISREELDEITDRYEQGKKDLQNLAEEFRIQVNL